MTPEPAAWAAVIPSPHGTFCYGWGEDRATALAQARLCWQGADAAMQGYMVRRLRFDPLTAAQASEVAEMLATPW